MLVTERPSAHNALSATVATSLRAPAVHLELRSAISLVGLRPAGAPHQLAEAEEGVRHKYHSVAQHTVTTGDKGEHVMTIIGSPCAEVPGVGLVLPLVQMSQLP